MKKPYILGTAIFVTLLGFGLLAWVFMGVRTQFMGYFQGRYIQPTVQDSLYTQLLQTTTQRPAAMRISHEVQPFYFWADSTFTLLRAGLSPELTHITLLQSGLSDSLYQQLHAIEQSALIPCHPPCFADSLHTPKAWTTFLQQQSPQDLEAYLKMTIQQVRAAELAALKEL